ncbi:sensor histidine kinase [Psychroserpens jangbogonensis]|uniref:sensor histidine kinase n=1 Tax=Psychroserpens jangbogonensis TaxID=1484460 RepID=UPI001F4CA965|nr:HAMP domain-containing sensor histidine kinase [Psychroserpens jangbogonensis]
MHDFFESVEYNDFSQWFNEKSGPEDIRELHEGFNAVNQKIKDINKDKEVQYLYLQKILELIDTGIVAYSINTGDIIWINESFKELLKTPTFKNIQFIKKRSENIFKTVFEAQHINGSTISIETEKNKTKLLISTAHFQMNNEEFKLIVLQNIENTLNQNQSEAWNKLLHIMTHEIMNSIAPISSLAETLQAEIKLNIEDSEKYPLDTNDLYLSINSIQKRSEGLMSFSKSYRGLNKITTINANKIYVRELFDGINNLLKPSLKSKGIDLQFIIDNQNLQINMDAALIEQVLINLIMNSVDACIETNQPKIMVSAKTSNEGYAIIKVTDNGKGIPDEIVDKIFIPFFSSKKKGSGIGLSLCQQIMFLHNGKIQVNSIENSGTVIRLVF